MSYALNIPVKESISEIRKLLRSVIPFLQPRLKLLLAMKKHNNNPVSKATLMNETGLCSYSVQSWRTLYAKGGIESLLKHNKRGFKPSIISKDNHEKLASKLNDPENGIRGYKELHLWAIEEFNIQLSYDTLYKYCVRHFKSKIKVARKYHAKKDEEKASS